ADRKAAEEVHQHRADEGGDEDADVGQVDRVEQLATAIRLDPVDLVDVGAEDEERGQAGARDRVALGNRLGGVAHRIQAVRDLARVRLGSAELRYAASVVGDGSKGVHGQDGVRGHQHAHRGDGGAEDAPHVHAIGVDQLRLGAEPVAGDDRD